MRIIDRLLVLKLAAAADVDPRSARKALEAVKDGGDPLTAVRGRPGERIASALPALLDTNEPRSAA